MVFPKNNLPTQSQPWTRDVEKRVENLESSFRSAEVNNVTRDSQILSQIRRIDAATTEVQGIINNIYVTGTEEIDGAVLAENTVNGNVVVNGTLPGGKIQANTITATQIATNYVYAGSINAGQIDAGTINGININGSTITGSTLTTASAGNQRVILNSNNMTVNNGSVDTGSIYGSTYGGANSLNMISTNGWVLIGNGSSSTIGGTNPSAFTALVGNTQVNNGSFSVEGDITNAECRNNITTAAPNMYVSTGGLFMFTTNASSIEVKENVRPLDFDAEAFINVSPVTFDYKEGIIKDGSGNNIIGFIAEDFEEAGLGSQLVNQPEVEGGYKSLKYDKLYMFLHKVVQEQDTKIKALESRLAALESRV